MGISTGGGMERMGSSAPLPVFDERTGRGMFLDIPTHTVDGRQFYTRAGMLAVLESSVDVSRDVGPLDLPFPCGLTIWTEQKKVTINGQELLYPLPKVEFRILHAIASQFDRTQTHDEIMETVWGHKVDGEHLIKSHVRYLRKWLAAGIKPPEPNIGIIETVRGVGFRMGERAFDRAPLVFPTSPGR